MRTRSCVPFLALLLTAGCHPPLETKEHHIVHKGESARLVNPGGETVWVSVAKGETHALAAAVSRKDTAGLEAMVQSGKAFPVESGTPVRVLGESFNERHVEVTDGPRKGRDGWAPFEWLEPR